MIDFYLYTPIKLDVLKELWYESSKDRRQE